MNVRITRNDAIVEMSVCFRTATKVLCLYQNTVFDKLPDNDLVYLDFENNEQIDNLIKALESMKYMEEQRDED